MVPMEAWGGVQTRGMSANGLSVVGRNRIAFTASPWLSKKFPGGAKGHGAHPEADPLLSPGVVVCNFARAPCEVGLGKTEQGCECNRLVTSTINSPLSDCIVIGINFLYIWRLLALCRRAVRLG
jgi:hypothetical protein